MGNKSGVEASKRYEFYFGKKVEKESLFEEIMIVGVGLISITAFVFALYYFCT